MRVVLLTRGELGARDRALLGLLAAEHEVSEAARVVSAGSGSGSGSGSDSGSGSGGPLGALRQVYGKRRRERGRARALLGAAGDAYGGRFVAQLWAEVARAQERAFATRAAAAPEVPRVEVRGKAKERAAQLAELDADLFVQLGWGIVRGPVLDVAPVVSWHHGILPALRGLYSPFWAVARGRPDWLGVTIQRLNRGIDTGEVLAQRNLDPRVARDLVDAHLLLDEAALGLTVAVVAQAAERGRVEPLEAGGGGHGGGGAGEGVYLGVPAARDVVAFKARRGRFFGAE